MPKKLSHQEKVERALGKRPLSGTQVGQKLGFKNHRNVARALGTAVAQGKAVKTEDGKYQKAL